MFVLIALCVIDINTAGNIIPSRDTVIIDSVPWVEWMYGASPQAAAMILRYWDSRDYGRLIDYFFDRRDSLGNLLSDNHPNVLRELAIEMNTDTMTGGTSISMIKQGIEQVTNGTNGYSYIVQLSPQGNSANQWMFSWLKDEIDNGRPCHWNVLNYYYQGNLFNISCCAIGYLITEIDTFVVVKNPWNSHEEIWPLWTYYQGIYSNTYVVRLIHGGANPNNLFITNATDSGLVFQGGDTINITWTSFGTDIEYISIWLASSYDSSEWTLIEQYAPNTGTFEWIVPNESLYARINLQGFNQALGLEAADGSHYGFAILPTGIEEHNNALVVNNQLHNPTILTGPFFFPEDKNYKVFDITGRVVMPDKMKPGVYFIEVDSKITQKVVKVR